MAASPTRRTPRPAARQGLRIPRRFTRAGGDPFESFTFVRRHARITNPDGSVVFDMADVEVPDSWDQVAVDVLASKYFRKAGVPQYDVAGQPVLDDELRPVLGPERSAKQWALRLANAWRVWGERKGYFATSADAEAFRDEWAYMLCAQMASPNSPQHFNTGLFEAYGIVNDPNGEWYFDEEAGEVRESAHRYERSAANACFLLSVKDELVGDGSIFDSFEREARLFQGGSGAGSNFSRIRGKDERLSGGGRASGLMSFLKVSDAGAGAIKSGGTTRRAAKMVIVDDDHPEVFEFVWAKAREEEKAAALVAAGWDPAWNAEDGAYANVHFQNFNGSVMLSSKFMDAVAVDAEWHLVARTTGETIRVVRARELWDAIAEAAWRCADPGVMFRTTINDWNTAANDAEIVTSNPCFPGDAKVHTDKGLVAFRDLFERALSGEEFRVWTHDATSKTDPAEAMVLTEPVRYVLSGVNDIVRLRFSTGAELRCTPNHRIWTTNRGWVEAKDLTDTDAVKVLDLPAPPESADMSFPVSADPADYPANGDHRAPLCFPQEWTEDFAHYLGWLVGAGSMTRANVTTVYGSADARQYVLPRHVELLAAVDGGRMPKPSAQANGTVQLRSGRRQFGGFLAALGVSTKPAAARRVPWAVEQAPLPVVSAFLRGLFDAEGEVVDAGAKGRCVKLDSASRELLVGVQRLLTMFGIIARIDEAERKVEPAHAWSRSAPRSLRITSGDLVRFAAEIGFGLPAKRARLAEVVSTSSFDSSDRTARLVERVDEGPELTFNLTEPRNHSYVVNGVVVANCGEYLHVEDTACNLSSVNLVKFWDDASLRFDHEAFAHVVRLVEVMLEITVAMSHYPSAVIAKNSFEHRTTGVGYANLGALLMRAGLPYDSDGARAAMGALTALMHLVAYRTSTEMAAAVGPCVAYGRNAEHTDRVIRNHVRAAFGSRLDGSGLGDFEKLTVRPQVLDHDVLASTPFASLSEPVVAAGEALLDGLARHGVRNLFVSCIAPTGTIGLQMGCDTTGVEPDFALVKGKKLAGGGYMKIVNQSVAPALRGLGYDDAAVERILAHALGTGTLDGPTAVNRGSLAARGVDAAKIDELAAALPAAFDLPFAAAAVGVDLAALGFSAAEIESSSKAICGHHTVEGAPDLREEHLAVFDCANFCGDGTRVIAWEGHVRALGAVAPFVSGSISKTVNMPNGATIDDVKRVYELSYRLGVKNCAIYRDGSKGSQVLSSGSVADVKAGDVKAGSAGPDAAVVEAEEIVAHAARVLADIAPGTSPTAFYHGTTPPKFKLPAMRFGPTWKFSIGGAEVFVRANEYPDGTLGEVFIDLSKEGSTLKGILSCFAIAVSHGLQYGVPLAKFVDTFCFHTFEPNGLVSGHAHLKMANSIVDAIFRILGHYYLGRDDLVQVKGPARRVRVVVDDAAPVDVEVVPAGVAAESGAAVVPAGVAVDVDRPRNEPGPPCTTCGNATVRSGACYRCLSCGESSGCS